MCSIVESLFKLQNYGLSNKYALCSFVLYTEITNESRGLCMIIGVYDSKKEAQEMMIKLMDDTGIPILFIKPTGYFFELSSSDKATKTIVLGTKDGRIDRDLFNYQRHIEEEMEKEKLQANIFTCNKSSLKEFVDNEESIKNVEKRLDLLKERRKKLICKIKKYDSDIEFKDHKELVNEISKLMRSF